MPSVRRRNEWRALEDKNPVNGRRVGTMIELINHF